MPASFPASSFQLETRDAAMQRVRNFSEKAAQSPLPVLIEGETGTGKTTLARAIHALSERASRPFVIFNCAEVPWDRLVSTLFGVRRSAAASQPGRLHEAQNGTLLLREIGELPLDVQARIARLLASGEIEPLGAVRPERANVRVMATSTARLVNLAKAGTIREDLFYRLNVLPVYVPPLRERTTDLARLAEDFARRFAAETGRDVERLSAPALDLLARHDWPGNVRELESAVYRAVALGASRTLEPADFPHVLARTAGREAAASLPPSLAVPSAPVHVDAAIPARRHAPGTTAPDRFLTTKGEVTPLAELERELIIFALNKYEGHMSQIARALGIGRSTLYRKLKDYGLEADFGSVVA